MFIYHPFEDPALGAGTVFGERTRLRRVPCQGNGVMELWIFLALLLVFGPPTLAIVAICQSSEARRLGRENNRLLTLIGTRLETLEHENRLRRDGATARAATSEPGVAPAPFDAAAVVEPPVIAPSARSDAAPYAAEPAWLRSTLVTATSPADAESPAAAIAADVQAGSDAPAVDANRIGSGGSGNSGDAPPKQSASEPGRFETALASRWLVWLGAIAIALGGTFLVKFMIDQGVLTAEARVSLSFALGAALAFGGEWLRRRPLQRAIARIRPDYVPGALTSSGLFVAFASVYSAYALYGLISEPVAFAALAAVALSGVGLSLLQGRFVALLGLLGAFATPMLIETPDPSAWLLFSYLLPVSLACFALARYRGWWWYAGATLVLATLWPLSWLLANGTDNALLPLGLYIFAIFGACFAVGHAHARSSEPLLRLDWAKHLTGADAIAIAGSALTLFLLWLTVRIDDYSLASLAMFGGFGIAAMVLGRRFPAYDALPVGAAISTLLLMLAWPMPESLTLGVPLNPLDGSGGLTPAAPMVPLELADFAFALVGFAALYGIGGFFALWGARRPTLFAAVSTLVPALLLALAFWRIVDFSLDLRWAAISLAFAACSLYAAGRLDRHRVIDPNLDGAFSCYAAAVCAFISLGAAMSLKQAWLTVALSLQLPALGWIARRVPTTTLKVVAATIASIVLVRLAFNPRILEYPVGDEGVVTWLLYGYGIPALSFFAAAALFRPLQSKRLVAALQAGGLAFFVLLVSWQIRYFVTGSLDTPHYGLAEQSIQTLAWLSIGFALWCHERIANNRVSYFGARALLGLAATQILFGHLVVSNPLVTGKSIGDWPILNILMLAYLLPALACFGFARILRGELPVWLQRSIAPFGLLLLFVYVTFEIKHAFQGRTLDFVTFSDAELYAYSIGWLAFAGVLLAIGIWKRSTPARHAALAVLLATVVKVFVFDMADLTGLYRAASFIGLGLSLVGIGFLYQRFVFRRDPAALAENPA